MSEKQPIDPDATPEDGDQSTEITEGMRLMSEAQKKRRELSRFGTTLEDEKRIGSPPLLLWRNPGKTLGELLPDEDILRRLDELLTFRESAEATLKNDPHDDTTRDDFEYAKRELHAAIKYLDSIGRLPGKYKNHPG